MRNVQTNGVRLPCRAASRPQVVLRPSWGRPQAGRPASRASQERQRPVAVRPRPAATPFAPQPEAQLGGARAALIVTGAADQAAVELDGKAHLVASRLEPSACL